MSKQDVSRKQNVNLLQNKFCKYDYKNILNG